MTRFAVYEVVKNTMADRSRDASGKAPPLTFLQKAALAGISGFAGGLVGNPADLVNVRSRARSNAFRWFPFLKYIRTQALSLSTIRITYIVVVDIWEKFSS